MELSLSCSLLLGNTLACYERHLFIRLDERSTLTLRGDNKRRSAHLWVILLYNGVNESAQGTQPNLYKPGRC